MPSEQRDRRARSGAAGAYFVQGLCFAGLMLANALVVVDMAIAPEVSIYVWRLGVAAFSLMLLLYGLIFESD